MDTLDRLFAHVQRCAHFALVLTPPQIVTLCGAIATHVLLCEESAALTALQGKRICLHVRRPNRTYYFVVRSSHLWPAASQLWDARISADMDALIGIMLGRDDADTLFFNRQLAVEGDTEIALHLRNALDQALYRARRGQTFASRAR